MFLDNKLIFLAGATGMTGSAILRYIIDNCPKVKIRAAYFNTQPFIKDSRIEYVRADLRSLDECLASVNGCDAAIMAAAHSAGAEFIISRPWEHMKENLFMNTQMLEAFQIKGIKRVIYISSATLYQDFEGSIKEEELDLNRDPAKAYLGFGWTVRLIERLTMLLHERYGTQVVIARAANIFGPYAKFDPKNSNFIPALIRKAADKSDPFEIWGSPEVTRDVIYAPDFARAVVMMMNNEDIKCDIFNVGTGIRTTVSQVAQWALKYAQHSPAKIRYLQDKPVTIKFRSLDCEKVKSALGWQPQYTPEQGIKATTQWWVTNKGWWAK